jgi:thiamine biosynthesis lipoprotein
MSEAAASADNPLRDSFMAMASLNGKAWRVAWMAAATLNLHAAGADGQGVRREYHQLHLGMSVRMIVHADAPAQADHAARAAFATIAALEDVFSDWRPMSETRRMSTRAGEWTTVSPGLFAVLTRALTVADLTGGAFDPTIGPLTAVWRGAFARRELPSDSIVSEARARVGWRRISLDSTRRAVWIGVPGMRIDLGGIAKGWILQAASETLASAGAPSHLIEAGGDIYAGAPPPGKDGWSVMVRTGGGDSTISISRAAVATSGSTEQFMVIGGRRYSHIVDPRTGLGVSHAALVTVVARSGADADALATALVVLDREAGDRLATMLMPMHVFRSD